MDADIQIVLVAVTSLYALFLDRFKEQLFEPDFTWAEVVIGVAIVLGAAYWRATRHSEWTGTDGVLAVLLAFAIGGAPIIIWRVVQMTRNYRAALRQKVENERRRHTLQISDTEEHADGSL